MNTNTSTQLNLSRTEKTVYGQLFRAADKDGIGVITGDVARDFFQRSNLSPLVLGEIWQIADTDNNGFLTQYGFSIACRLIGHAQAGEHVSSELSKKPGPIPRFDIPANPSSVSSARVASPPVTTTASRPGLPSAVSTPTLNPSDKQRFIQLFERSATNGIVTGEKARDIFLKARLTPEVLGQIWNLADIQQNGFLNQAEFVIAMHLIHCTLNGTLKGIPNQLPPGLLESARGTPTASRNVQRVSSPQTSVPATGSASLNNAFGPGTSTSLSNWVISPSEKTRFDSLFNSLDTSKRNVLGANEIVPFLKTSKLSDEILAQVWDLADIKGNGEFTREEFAIAMFLVQQSVGGQQLPNTLPPQLLSSASGPNPVFLSPQSTGQPQRAATFAATQVSPQITQAPIPKHSNKGSLDDLFELNDAFNGLSSPTIPAVSNASATTQSPSLSEVKPITRAETLPLTAATTGLQPFVPQSSFGQSIQQQFSGNSGLNATSSLSSGVSPVVNTSEKNLLDEPDATVPSSSISKGTTDIANLSNQITSLTDQTQKLKTQRESSEKELSKMQELKKDIEKKLKQLRVVYDTEVKKVQQVDSLLTNSKNETAKLRRESSVLEASYHALQSQYQEASAALELDQNENNALKEKIKLTTDELSHIKEELEKIKKEARHQKGLVAINKKQLNTLEDEKISSKSQLEAARAQIADEGSSPGTDFLNSALASTSSQPGLKNLELNAGGSSVSLNSGSAIPTGLDNNQMLPPSNTSRSESPNESFARIKGSQLSRTQSNSSNPFYGLSPHPSLSNANNASATSISQAYYTPQGATGITTINSTASGESYGDAYLRNRENADHATTITTESSRHTEDTPISSPPGSDVNPLLHSSSFPSITAMHFNRPGSASSSVQNNAPQSVRGDVDLSRPDSSLSQPTGVSSIVDQNYQGNLESQINNLSIASTPINDKEVSETISPLSKKDSLSSKLEFTSTVPLSDGAISEHNKVKTHPDLESNALKAHSSSLKNLPQSEVSSSTVTEKKDIGEQTDQFSDNIPGGFPNEANENDSDSDSEPDPFMLRSSKKKLKSKKTSDSSAFNDAFSDFNVLKQNRVTNGGQSERFEEEFPPIREIAHSDDDSSTDESDQVNLPAPSRFDDNFDSSDIPKKESPALNQKQKLQENDLKNKPSKVSSPPAGLPPPYSEYIPSDKNAHAVDGRTSSVSVNTKRIQLTDPGTKGTSGSGSKTGNSRPEVTSPFDTDFSGLSDAKDDKGDEFNSSSFQDNFDDFENAFDSSRTVQIPLQSQQSGSYFQGGQTSSGNTSGQVPFQNSNAPIQVGFSEMQSGLKNSRLLSHPVSGNGNDSNDEWEEIFAAFGSPHNQQNESTGYYTTTSQSNAPSQTQHQQQQAPSYTPLAVDVNQTNKQTNKHNDSGGNYVDKQNSHERSSSKTSSGQPDNYEDQINELVAMGFSQKSAQKALKKTKYNLSNATNYLLDHS